MDNFTFFDLTFEQYEPKVSKDYANDKTNKQKGITSDSKVADEFVKFFYVHNLSPLFTDESRTSPITVSWIQAQSVLKNGGKANKLLKEFANWISLGMDNKSYERAMFKILHNSRSWEGFLKQIQDHLNYLPYIESNYLHNTWNIVFYDKDKSGTKVSKGI